MSINLGDKARDTITGLTGTVTSRHQYLNGCIRLTLQPSELKDGKPVDCSTFDIEQLELIEATKPRAVTPSGGSHDEPSRQNIPAR